MKFFNIRITRKYASLGLVLIFAFASCKTLNRNLSYDQMVTAASPQAKLLLENPDFSNCNIRFHKDFEDVKLKCNLWGESKLKSGIPVLCTFKRENDWGWRWEIPENARGVIGYPALEVGRNPWGKDKKDEKIAGFPIQVYKISNLTVDYEVEMYVKHRKYNLAFDLWLTDIEFGDGKNIKTEIMIWEDYFDFSSYGKVKEIIETPFGEYKVHTGYLKNEKFAQDWTYVAFVRTEKRDSGTVDIKYLLNYLVSNEIISEEHYFTSIEFGNEIGNSSGLTLVKQFDWDFEVN